jgi:hypothetical protein
MFGPVVTISAACLFWVYPVHLLEVVIYKSKSLFGFFMEATWRGVTDFCFLFLQVSGSRDVWTLQLIHT